MRCLVTGATGYIGGRLAPRLVAAGHQVRCLTRDANRLRDVPWAGDVEVVEGDLSDPGTLPAAFEDVDVAYFLMHSLGRKDFERRDREAAQHFAAAAEKAGVRRIIYLGGPQPPEGGTQSAHLRSRAEVARVLLDSAVPTAVLRAAVIIGSGSASFEMLRYLTERLPVMVTPRWVRNRIQPIAVRDVLHYLIACAGLPPEVNRGFDIGGTDVLTYLEMMQRYARVAGLRRRLIAPLRPLTPRLSAHWVGAVTPVPNKIAKPLVESLIHEAIAHEHDIAEYIPDEGLLGFDESVRVALGKIRDANVETRWSTASGRDAAAEPLPSDPDWSGGTLHVDERRADVDAPAAALWRVVESVGGANGWYSPQIAWRARGWMDRLVGGIGMRRGRRDQQRLHVGEAVDFWRVEEVVPGRLLRLRAEMRLPGRAWLEFRVEEIGPDRSRLIQRNIFLPRGLAGQAYWTGIMPFHAPLVATMARNIAREAISPPRGTGDRARPATPR
jgi:uncharacterized protein YbjT (DUF2867 family)